MSTIEIKKQLINKIEKINDENFLIEVYRFLEMNESCDDVFDLSPETIIAIEEGMADASNGVVKPHDQVKKEMAEWLSK